MNKQEYPLVSVIIPNYNHARYLDQRLQSVLGQTYPNFEVIILDDKSTDNSLEVIAKYQNDPHVSQVVVNKENSGNTFKQWDKGISLAKGDIIWIAESDDFCELNMLEDLVKAYTKKHGTVLAYAPVVYVNDNAEITGRYSIEGRSQSIGSHRFVKNYLALDNVIQNASCAIFSRNVALKIDKRYINYPGVGDWWFWVEVAECGDVVIVNKGLSYFRRHDGTVTSRKTASGLNSIGFYELLMYIKSKCWISSWREDYIFRTNGWISKSNYDTDEIRLKVSQLWNFTRKYSKLELFIHRVMSHLKRRYLLYL